VADTRRNILLHFLVIVAAVVVVVAVAIVAMEKLRSS